ncbi:hypothetical protein [Salininema proteolyticum]|uniref:DUF1109 domain-containing protein n=1 Tax=Salininema proteolyticum TaxID=1607685 RepID=A0ABV8TX70_9ACTN
MPENYSSNALALARRLEHRVPPFIAVPVLAIVGLALIAGASALTSRLYWERGWTEVEAHLFFLSIALSGSWLVTWFGLWAFGRRGPDRPVRRLPVPARAAVSVALCALALAPLYVRATGGGETVDDPWVPQAVLLSAVLLPAAVLASVRVCRPEAVGAETAALEPTGLTSDDVLTANVVAEATGRRVLSTERRGEIDPASTGADSGGEMFLHYELQDGAWIEVVLRLQQFYSDRGYEELLDEAGVGCEREELEGWGDPTYRFQSADGESDFVWTAVDDAFVLEVRSSDHFGHEVRSTLARKGREGLW